MHCGRLVTAHPGDYYKQVKDKVDNLGPNLEGAKIGLVCCPWRRVYPYRCF
ncbi:hypothetical protein SAMN02745219_00401 [Desulfofundulus thermosubterraneus DSM 16057]|uniref:Uncharacterized protein n=1 Tax=Desulfofundulus thermosubterraneus DSM 16057 TaxID=1121432 RepID=A0A1M6BI42_9FIRM|nr:hypothetical protein SAMN02745219_00401 [Desulfofundulus thermosubterraneus DSM 16057]